MKNEAFSLARAFARAKTLIFTAISPKFYSSHDIIRFVLSTEPKWTHHWPRRFS